MATAILNMGKPVITAEMQKYVQESKDAIKTIDAVTEPDRTLSSDYATLVTELEAAIAAESATDLASYNSKLNGFSSRFIGLNERKVQFLATASPSIYTLTDLAQLTYGATLDTILFFVVLTAAILGGAIVSNTFIEETTAYRLFYFVYGAAFFPFSILYGIFDPPEWRSTIFPWVLKGEESSWMSRFPASILWGLFAYSAPSPLDKEKSAKGLLRIFSIGVLIAFIVSYFLVYERLPI